MESKEIKLKPNTTGTSKNEQIEEFLNMKYSFRFNTIKCKPEFKLNSTKDPYIPLDKYTLNSIKRELDAYGISTSTSNLKEILESEFSPAVNPVKEYFKYLPKWDLSTDYIKQLSETVKVRNHEKWYEYLKKWLVAVVANVFIDEKCANHTCLVLTGVQGVGKTTWLENLCPKDLVNYLYTGKINPENKDVLTYIAEFLFINIDDQLRQLNRTEENELKNLITVNHVKYRRPYDPFITEYPHLASFMASVNGNDFLTDSTGSRRFLPFEVLDIYKEKTQRVDMNNVYSQALYLFKNKFRYWFNDEEIIELYKNNESFQAITIEEELLIEYFSKPSSRANATHFFTSSVIKTKLEEYTRQKINAKKLGEALTKLGYEKWQRTHEGETKWVWSVIQKDGIKLNEQNDNFNRTL